MAYNKCCGVPYGTHTIGCKKALDKTIILLDKVVSKKVLNSEFVLIWKNNNAN